MKTATLPSIRVAPEFRAAVESLLSDTETLSEFVEASVRESVIRRSNQMGFLARGIQSLESARQSNDYINANEVVGKLRARLAAARKQSRPVRR